MSYKILRDACSTDDQKRATETSYIHTFSYLAISDGEA